ncbi:MAG: hypothetical protein KGN84_17700 [Acidobacteriota bacterium]|nr:hypothetical protein [Acidobacteriota bacterium]
MAPTLAVAPIPSIKAKKGGETTVTVKASLPAGYHANSNKPTYSYLIPLTLTWKSGPLEMASIAYPEPKTEHYGFQLATDKPLSVVTGEFSIVTKFKVPAGAQTGPASEAGTLRYQACDNKACYPPKNIPVSVVVSVE